MDGPKPVLPPVPKGLKKCRKCGDYKGTCIQKEAEWKIDCSCHPHICRHCNNTVFKYRIFSNFYDPLDGHCWHVNVFTALEHMASCPGYNRITTHKNAQKKSGPRLAQIQKVSDQRREGLKFSNFLDLLNPGQLYSGHY